MLLAVVLAGAAVLLVSNREDLATSWDAIGWRPVLVSGVLAVIGTMTIGGLWLSLLLGVQVAAPPRDGLAVFFVTQLGKYVPGSVWPIVAQMEVGRRWGAQRRTMLAVNLLMLATLGSTGLFLSVVLLPWALPGAGISPWWALVALPVLVMCLHPRALPELLRRGLGMLAREPVDLRLSARAARVAVAWAGLAWCILGAHLWVLLRAAGAHGGASLAAALGGMAVAWVAGLVVVLAPAGAGVREAVLVAVCAPFVGTQAALAVALASRALLVVADVLLAGLGALTWMRLRAPRSVGGVEE